MVIYSTLRGATYRHEHLQYEILYIEQGVRIAIELRIIPADISLGILDFLFQKIHLIQEQDYGDILKCIIIYNRIEDIPWLLQSIRHSTIIKAINDNECSFFNIKRRYPLTTVPILGQHLIKFGGRHQEYDGRHRCIKASRPLLSLGSLATNIHKHKWYILQCRYMQRCSLGFVN